MLETIYRLAGVSAPNAATEVAYPGYPLRARSECGALDLLRAVAAARWRSVVRDAQTRFASTEYLK